MVHTFKCLGGFYVLDVESGSLFKTDEPVFKLINAANSPEGYDAGEFLRCADGEMKEAAAEVAGLIGEGVLFSPAPEAAAPVFDGAVKSLCLNVSHRCNLRCGYCFADGGSYAGRAENMPLEVALKAVDFLIKKSGKRKNLEIDFFGGEPLLNTDVIKKTTEYARSLEKSTGKTFRFTVTTNAYALDDAATEFFNREMYNVVLSIDGRESVHNHMRKTAGGKDSFATVLKNAQRFRELRGDRLYYVRGTFTSQNLDFASDAAALADYGFDSISLEPVVLPPAHPLAIKESDVETLCAEYERLAKIYLERKKSGNGFGFFHFAVDMDGGPCEAKRLRNCGAGCDYAAVTPSGEIYPCHQFAGNAEYRIGSVLDNSFDSSVSERFKRNHVLNKSECSACWAKYYCSGGCAANSVLLCGDMLKPVGTLCALMKKRTECALALYDAEQALNDDY